MNRQIIKLWVSLFFLLFFCMTSQAANLVQQSPVGYWTTISDEDGKPRSIVQITQEKGKLVGSIIKVYAKPTDRGLCVNCPGVLKNKPIVGMRIMWDLEPKGDFQWAGGTILDPKKGKKYKCKLELAKQGKELLVRGYIGISLFGRTQTWIRKS